MPELPEAETIARDLRRRIAGRRIAGVDVRHRDVLAPGLSPATLDAGLRGRALTEVGRRGKNVVLHFGASDDARILVVNLGMTGRLVASAARRAGELGHIAVRFRFEDGEALLFDDVRRFGRLDLYDAAGWGARRAELGLEPLDDAFTAARLHALTRASRTPIRNLLLDQRKVAGVGNIYANEALYRAGIRPRRAARSLTRAEAARLCDALRAVLRDAIRARGTTLRDYRDGGGEAGGFEPLLEAYGRNGAACPRCGATIKRVVVTNRSAFYCPGCQR